MDKDDLPLKASPLIADELMHDPRVAQAKQLLKDALEEHRSRITGMRPPSAARKEEYADLIKKFSAYPRLSSLVSLSGKRNRQRRARGAGRRQRQVRLHLGHRRALLGPQPSRPVNCRSGGGLVQHRDARQSAAKPRGVAADGAARKKFRLGPLLFNHLRSDGA